MFSKQIKSNCKLYAPTLFPLVDREMRPETPETGAREVINRILKDIGSDYVIHGIDEIVPSLKKAEAEYLKHRDKD